MVPENDSRKSFFSIEWPYIYSLNIDDAVEGNCQYTGKILPFRNVNEDFYDREKCIIKLHGDIEELLKYNDAYKVFTTQEYAQSLINNEFLLNKLRNDYANQNILFIGCGLEDEIDLISLQKLPVNFKQKETMNKVFYFMKGEPSALKKPSLNRFGITDIVCFEEYEDMYCFLNKAWHQRQQLQTDDLFKHAITSLNELDASDKTENQRYFYNVDGLYDGDKQVLTFP